ncbi:HD-GYP domain-containing protein [Sporolituus thermophilus]|uniref:HD-GYP domain, c-di-GMP phosphodiesterase class II (Or its inactivated variant) n=1 Tax=Sporolituus thermophilus DSM 23256 TaxID=1123285 RepID=A0A1G7HSG3_9FIRM|nr:HD domain-containing phosphohydrolase [Sporolituus thermophilus]SDF03437.1 HD-GYP domain, c-di-GMP phosphodiesterase class II (or its inactivated variant) [Sporolituus thermophilus DSM 23256]
MQRISIAHLRPGMVVARNVFSAQGQLLLCKGCVLTKRYIDRLRHLGITSIYIANPYTDDLEVPEAIREETRQQAIATVQQSFAKFRLEQRLDLAALESAAQAIVDELLKNRATLIHLTDIRTYDDYTFGHSVNVSILSVFTGLSLGFARGQLEELALGSLLHDVGKIAIPPAILNKPGKLAAEEMAVMQQHAATGFAILHKQNPEIPLLAAHIAFQHHERLDGSGYPRGLKGDEIHPYARIAAIADVYDALTSDRPYRRAMPPHEAYETLLVFHNKHFDGAVLDQFLRRIACYPVGSFVQLSSGEVGVIVHVPPDLPLRPTVRLLTDREGQAVSSQHEIDLTKELSTFICKVLAEEEIIALGNRLSVQGLSQAFNY